MYPAAIDPLALNRRSTQPCKRWVRIVYGLACLIALTIALYLTAMKLTGRISDLAGCGGEGGCASILGGRWANWLRVPISLWAIGIYATLLLLGVLGLSTPIQRRLAFIGTSVLVAAAAWFLYVQAMVERQFCPYCLALHACGVLAFACIGSQIWSRDLSERAVSLLSAGVVASLAMMALILGQFFGPQVDTHQITREDSLAAASEPLASNVPTEPQGAASAGTDAAANRENLESRVRGERPTVEPSPLPDQGGVPDNGPSGAPPPPDLDVERVAQETNPPRESTTTPATPQTSAPAADPTVSLLAGPNNGRIVSYFDGAIRLPVDELPLIGRPDAEHILLKYFDYTCTSCRRMHNDLEVALTAYPQELAVIVIPCPLNTACNPHADQEASRARGPGSHEYACELARLALAMWRVAPEKFEAFHNELFARQGRMTPAAALIVGDAMIQQKRLKAAMDDVWIDSLLKHSTGIYGRMKQSNPRMPKLLLGDRNVLHGVAVSSDELVKALREHFRLGEPASAINPAN